MFNKRKMDLVHNPLGDSLFSDDRTDTGQPTPPSGDEFLLLDGTNFLLLDGTNFDLL